VDSRTPTRIKHSYCPFCHEEMNHHKKNDIEKHFLAKVNAFGPLVEAVDLFINGEIGVIELNRACNLAKEWTVFKKGQ